MYFSLDPTPMRYILRMRRSVIALAFCLVAVTVAGAAQGFVEVRDHQLYRDGRPYRFIGTNYWYASLLPLEKDASRGIGRLRRELDFLKKQGITNLRLMAGAEGSGLLNGVPRVGPPLQPEAGKFDARVLDGLDRVLVEMAKRDMTAVIFLTNNWEWSGGFQQYLLWHNVIDQKWRTQKPSWDELRDIVAKFYGCRNCVDDQHKQIQYVLQRRNRITGKLYIDDPTIMAWELANEPRPMRPSSNEAYKNWIGETSRLIRSLDKKHLITTGHEGWIGTQDIAMFESVHSFPTVDYLTIHIWPKNWGWFVDGKMSEEHPKAFAETTKYIRDNLAVAVRLGKPMVIEEFGLPRDAQSFDPKSSTKLRDAYFELVFDEMKSGHIAGANFWAFGGKPVASDRKSYFWSHGDEYTGDPPMEEQGLYSVFESDASTWKVLREAAARWKAN